MTINYFNKLAVSFYRGIVALSLFVCAAINHLNAQVKKDSPVYCQLQYKFSIPGQFKFVTADQWGFVYGISQSGSLIKYSATGDSVTAFNDVVRFGKPTSADVSNPFKVMLYSRRFPGCIILDRQLNFQSTISFQQNGLTNVSTAATSYDNRLWLFDQQRFTLKKFDEQATLLFESNDFRQLTGQPIRVEKILDVGGNLYLYDPSQGFMITDYYGNYQTQWPLLGWIDVGIMDQWLYGRIGQMLYAYHKTSFREIQLKLPETINYSSIFMAGQKIYFNTDTGIKVFALIPNQFQ